LIFHQRTFTYIRPTKRPNATERPLSKRAPEAILAQNRHALRDSLPPQTAKPDAAFLWRPACPSVNGFDVELQQNSPHLKTVSDGVWVFDAADDPEA